MICPNCGKHNREGAKFCDECGIVLPTSAAAPRATTTPPNTPYAARPQRMVARRAVSDEPPTPVLDETADTRSDEQPSGTTMLDDIGQSDTGRARRMFALIAGLLILSLCVCCGAAAIALYALTQNPS